MISRNVLYVFLSVINVIINLDHGIVPAATLGISRSLHLDQQQLGLLGSAVFLGIVFTGIYAGRLYHYFPSKYILLVGLFALQGALILFTVTQSFAAALVARFLGGACEVFLLAFLPVWIDRYGDQHRTLWLTALQLGFQLGIFLGYGLTSLVTPFWPWQSAFIIQISMLGVCICILFFFVTLEQLDIQGGIASAVTELNQQNSAILSSSTTTAVAETTDIEAALLLQTTTIRRTMPGYWQMLRSITSSKQYIIAVLTFSVVLFVSTGIQFWLTDYFIKVLKVDPAIVSLGYLFASLTAPTTGMAYGGYLMQLAGGYHNNPRCIYVVFLVSAVGMSCAALIPFVDKFLVAAVLLWGVLFFGAAMVPGLSGLILSSVEFEMRAFGSSTAETIKNLFGLFPAPFLYGLLTSLTGWQRAGITLSMFWGLLAPFLLLIGSVLTHRELTNKGKD